MWITGRDGGVGEHNYVGKELESFLSHKERIELTEKIERGTLWHTLEEHLESLTV